MRIFFSEIEVIGRENIPTTGATIFVGMLFHRNSRDDSKCAAKYGKDWETYCREVPYILIPGIY